MPNIPDQPPNWTGVRLIEKTDKVLGGMEGAANQQAMQMLQCVGYVRQGVEEVDAALAETTLLVAQARSSADTATLAAQNAQAAADAAQASADAADIKAVAADTKAVTAQADAAAAATKADQAQSKASQAEGKANAAQAKADSADTKATNAAAQAGMAGNEAAQAMVAANAKAVRVDLGSVTIIYSAVLALGAGARSIAVNCTGARVGDAIFVAATGAIPDGYAVGAAQCLVADVIRVSVVHPALVLGASFSIPLRVFALR